MSLSIPHILSVETKVIKEKSRGEGSLMEQDTIENASKHNLFFDFLRIFF